MVNAADSDWLQREQVDRKKALNSPDIRPGHILTRNNGQLLDMLNILNIK